MPRSQDPAGGGPGETTSNPMRTVLFTGAALGELASGRRPLRREASGPDRRHTPTLAAQGRPVKLRPGISHRVWSDLGLRRGRYVKEALAPRRTGRGQGNFMCRLLQVCELHIKSPCLTGADVSRLSSWGYG